MTTLGIEREKQHQGSLSWILSLFTLKIIWRIYLEEIDETCYLKDSRLCPRNFFPFLRALYSFGSERCDFSMIMKVPFIRLSSTLLSFLLTL